MNFVARVFEDAIAFLLAFVIVLAVLAYFGSTPTQRYECDMKSDNVIADTVCIIKTI